MNRGFRLNEQNTAKVLWEKDNKSKEACNTYGTYEYNTSRSCGYYRDSHGDNSRQFFSDILCECSSLC